ncbi:hypothetical protein DM56_4297 [Burkholderia mallei]|nr:hypothetical protein DM56_4297 [Burkholderia mallei]KOT19326.1 hypothetical protein DM52_1146 [Burkholderia mallei]
MRHQRGSGSASTVGSERGGAPAFGAPEPAAGGDAADEADEVDEVEVAVTSCHCAGTSARGG